MNGVEGTHDGRVELGGAVEHAGRQDQEREHLESAPGLGHGGKRMAAGGTKDLGAKEITCEPLHPA